MTEKTMDFVSTYPVLIFRTGDEKQLLQVLVVTKEILLEKLNTYMIEWEKVPAAMDILNDISKEADALPPGPSLGLPRIWDRTAKFNDTFKTFIPTTTNN